MVVMMKFKANSTVPKLCLKFESFLAKIELYVADMPILRVLFKNISLGYNHTTHEFALYSFIFYLYKDYTE